MMLCDNCEERIMGGDRVAVPCKDDPYGEETDWCQTCADVLNGGINKIRTESHIKLKADIQTFLANHKGLAI